MSCQEENGVIKEVKSNTGQRISSKSRKQLECLGASSLWKKGETKI